MITLRYISPQISILRKHYASKNIKRFFLNFFVFFIILYRKNDRNTEFYEKQFLDRGIRSFLIVFCQNIKLKSSVHKSNFMYALCNYMEDSFKWGNSLTKGFINKTCTSNNVKMSKCFFFENKNRKPKFKIFTSPVLLVKALRKKKKLPRFFCASGDTFSRAPSKVFEFQFFIFVFKKKNAFAICSVVYII